MKKVIKYRVYCETDSKNEEVLLEESAGAPIACPVDPAHTIDTEETTIIDEISADEVEITNKILIEEEDTSNKTGGRFRVEGLDFVVPATIGKHIKDFTFANPRALLSAQIDVNSDWIGDYVRLLIAPETTIGIITVAGAVAQTVFDVSQDVINNIQVGFLVEIDGQDCGECVSIDTTTNKITVETGLSAAAAINTLVKISVIMAKDIKFTTDKVSKDIGQSKIGSSHLPAGVVIRAIYDNKTETAKDFHFTIEMLY